MKLPHNFSRYFLIAGILLFLGIVSVILQTAMANPHIPPLDHAGLQSRADYHHNTVIPFMTGAFFRLLFLNGGVALFVLVIPVFWVWVWWFGRKLLPAVIISMQGTVGVLMLALGHNSFSKIYITYRLLPWPVVASLYFPHGWLEMLAFVLAGTCSFLCIDALKIFLEENGNQHALHPGEICLFILSRTWKAGLAIFFLMAIAAAIECWVTPVLAGQAFQAALMGVA